MNNKIFESAYIFLRKGIAKNSSGLYSEFIEIKTFSLKAGE
jgi:hypothetical protein